jgi:hypothetical protein
MANLAGLANVLSGLFDIRVTPGKETTRLKSPRRRACDAAMNASPRALATPGGTHADAMAQRPGRSYLS